MPLTLLVAATGKCSVSQDVLAIGAELSTPLFDSHFSNFWDFHAEGGANNLDKFDSQVCKLLEHLAYFHSGGEMQRRVVRTNCTNYLDRTRLYRWMRRTPLCPGLRIASSRCGSESSSSCREACDSVCGWRLARSVGGLDIMVQENGRSRNSDVVIATPGKLIDHVKNIPSFGMQSIEVGPISS